MSETPASPGEAVLAGGPDDAPVIVFVHGTRLSRMVWTPQVEALAGPFRVVATDLPGHGHRAAEPFSLDAAADIVAATIGRSTRHGRAIVVGLSLGGYVAMTLAAREPELIRGLVLSGATAEPVGMWALPYLALARLMASSDHPRWDRLDAALFRSRFPPAIAESVIAGGFWPIGGAAALRALAGERFIPRLAAYPGPCLILNGEYDLPFRLGAPAFAAAARDVRRVRLVGASHLANLDRPAAFSAAVARFAASLPGE